MGAVGCDGEDSALLGCQGETPAIWPRPRIAPVSSNTSPRELRDLSIDTRRL